MVDRIAVGDDGSLYALATPSGPSRKERIAFSFTSSARAANGSPRFSPCSESTAWAKEAAGAREEITRGRLWWQDGWLYHVLHATRVVRIFKADGTPVRTVSFVAPDSSQLFASAGLKADPRLNRVWRIAHLPDGRFLIEWLHVESPGLGTQRATTFVALHDEQGRPLCVGSHPPVRPAIPVAVDAGAACCFCT